MTLVPSGDQSGISASAAAARRSAARRAPGDDARRARLTAAFRADRYYMPPEEALEQEVGRPSGDHFNLLHLETGLRADCYLAGGDELSRVRKLEYRRQGAGEHHVDDVARMLRVSRALIDQATLDGWIARVGVAREWKEALDRLARMA
jgi:hypothetical protein